MSLVEATPEWLTSVRETAAAAAVDAPFPSDSEEVWRYSRIGDVDVSEYRLAADPISEIDTIRLPAMAAVIDVRDGWITSVERIDVADAIVGPLVDHPEARSLFGSVQGGPTDSLRLHHDRSIGDPVVVDVPARTMISDPIVIDVYSDVDAGLTAPHTIIRAGRGSSVTVLERRRSGDRAQLVMPWVEIDAGPDARIAYQVVQQLGSNTISLEQHTSQADQQSHVVTAVAAFGGSYARTRADFTLGGRGASGDLLAAYFGDSDQMLDFRTFQHHVGPDTTSKLLFHGAVTGAAASVYTGLIRVAETAPGTNAFQTNRNLKLSDDAWAYSVPNLEIEQNQVSCSHASTIGEIDDDQRFYLESRGVPTEMAEQLLVSGFFADVIAQMPVDSVKAELQHIIDAALAADRASRGGHG